MIRTMLRRARAAACQIAGRAIVLTLAITPAHALVGIGSHPNSGLPVLSINGMISDGDVTTLQFWVDHFVKNNVQVHMNAIRLDSTGGSGQAAIRLGRFIRERRLNTFVGPNERCVSACVYVLAGGVTRLAYGSIYIHRFILGETNISEADIRREVLKRMDHRRQYLAEMGMSPLMADAIQNTPNWALRKLSAPEKLHWNLHGINHDDDEVLSREAALQANLEPREFNDFYVENSERCRREAMRFERLIFDCPVRISNESQARLKRKR